MIPLLSATVFPNRLKLKPGNSTASFTVTVINESTKFAAFQLEIIAPGYAIDSQRKWYSTEPKVSTKKPPGSRTDFTVSVIDTPTPGYVGRLELMVRVFSVDFRDETRQPLSIDVEPRESYLVVELPIPRLQVYPRNPIEIPVKIYNPRRQAADVSLNLQGIHAEWLPNGSYQQLQVLAGQQRVVHFICQPPNPLSAPCEDYPFTLEAMPFDGASCEVQGVLEVLPAGFVEFGCEQKQLQIPPKRKFRWTWKSEPATYKFQLENGSNLWQDIDLISEGRDHQRCKVDIVPDAIILDPAEKVDVDFVVRKRRPWLGLARRLLLEAVISLKGTDNVNSQVVPNPRAQLLELKVLPIIPPWLQAALLLLLLLLLWLWTNIKPPRHLEPVTSVQISGDAGTILSGSRDQTIRRWQVNGDRIDDAGILARTGKAVRVIRYRPVGNNVVAAGLENGEVQFWDVLTRKKLKVLSFAKDDRVFGLAFTQDSRRVYSGHGSGRILEWNLEEDKKGQDKPTRQAVVDFSVYALAMSETPGQRLLLISGRYNQLALWDLITNRLYHIPYEQQENSTQINDNSQATVIPSVSSQQKYIESIATHQSTLATADNQGYISLWNLAKRRCKVSPTIQPNAKAPLLWTRSQYCDLDLLNQWRDGHQNKPVRSVAFTNNGCYLASTGDDGRVMIWPLTTLGMRNEDTGETQVKPEIEVSKINTRLNSVDAIVNQNQLLITSDDYDNQIRFYRLGEKGLNPSCQ
jgi:WD40 repeat protein